MGPPPLAAAVWTNRQSMMLAFRDSLVLISWNFKNQHQLTDPFSRRHLSSFFSHSSLFLTLIFPQLHMTNNSIFDFHYLILYAAVFLTCWTNMLVPFLNQVRRFSKKSHSQYSFKIKARKNPNPPKPLKPKLAVCTPVYLWGSEYSDVSSVRQWGFLDWQSVLLLRQRH